jgi:hypothetical protein
METNAYPARTGGQADGDRAKGEPTDDRFGCWKLL